ncbi:cotranscriptional regulator ARB2A homolog [Penaeus indicus]|uniref:cotranscriptional regulator ARB2A homolog n=1 Tax=Penaeus indicus TaxID=29960 RepID=UPI00300D8E78
MTTPQPTFPDTLAGFGYTFKDGKLKNIQTGGPFVFAVRPDDNDYNQKHYEALGELVQQEVYKLVKKESGMQKAPVPLNSQPGDPQTFVFLSRDFMANEHKVLVLIQGSGAVRAGQWSRKLTINEGIEAGTQIPYMQLAQRDGYGVLVMNPNDNSQIVGTQRQSIKTSLFEHKTWFFQLTINEGIEAGTQIPYMQLAQRDGYGVLVMNPNDNSQVVGNQRQSIKLLNGSCYGILSPVLAASAPLASGVEFDKYKDDFKLRVIGVALTSSTHKIADGTGYNDLIKISRHWQTSDQPLDTELQTEENEIKRVSAGSNTHEATSQACMESVFKFFEERYRAVLEG